MSIRLKSLLGSLSIGIIGFGLMTAPFAASENKEYNLLPKIRVESGGDTQSTGIDLRALKPQLIFGLFIPEDDFLKLPRIGYAQDAHILSADRDLVYSSDISEPVGETMAVYRQGKNYVEPKTKEPLGFMAFKSAEVEILEKQNTGRKNNIVMQVKHNVEPIDKTMRIAENQWPPILSWHYLKPVLREKPIDGFIIDVWDPGISLIGSNTLVVLSVGKREGVSLGDLLEIYRAKDLLDDPISSEKSKKDRPDIRVGRVLVYQVDEKLSLGIITEIYEKIVLFDKIRGEVLDNGDHACDDQTLGVHFFDDTCEEASGQPCKEGSAGTQGGRGFMFTE
jgi:hypothetical protein